MSLFAGNVQAKLVPEKLSEETSSFVTKNIIINNPRHPQIVITPRRKQQIITLSLRRPDLRRKNLNKKKDRREKKRRATSGLKISASFCQRD